MISIDTNIIIRFLTHDDEPQYKKAFSIFNSQDIFIPDTVIMEVEWVLRYAYGFSSDAIAQAFTRLFGLNNIHLSNPLLVAQAIVWHTQGMDFSDALHLAHCEQCETLYTFDKKFSSKAKGLSSCSVKVPE